MNKVFDNKPKGNKMPNIPDKGTSTGVTDTYGANLNKGHSGKQRIQKKNSKVSSSDYC